MMLKALGINITEPQVQMIETLIPQIPERLNQAGSLINNAVKNFDARLAAIEKTQQLILERLNDGSTNDNYIDGSVRDPRISRVG